MNEESIPQQESTPGMQFFQDQQSSDFVKLMGDNSLLLHELKMRLSGKEYNPQTEEWVGVDLPQVPKEAMQPILGTVSAFTSPISRFSQIDNDKASILSKVAMQNTNDIILLTAAYQEGKVNFNINAWASGNTTTMVGVACKMGMRQSVNALMLREVAGQHKTLRHIQNMEGKQTIREESGKGWFK